MKVLPLILIFMMNHAQALCLEHDTFGELPNEVEVHGAEQVTREFHLSVQNHLPYQTELLIKLDPHSPRMNAEINKSGNKAIIQVLGGMLKHPHMSPDVLRLLLCHELGHLLGGAPLKSRNGWSSTEGQADYYSGFFCAKTLGMTETTFLDAALNLATIYAEVAREPGPKINSCDERVVERTNFGYPSVQCRLDTMIAGWNHLERPRCWFGDL
jgi:hypothetical protein